eukprot:COSAG06_NODE_4377_length_4316_cov_2.766025_2_plen_133_part_00
MTAGCAAEHASAEPCVRLQPCQQAAYDGGGGGDDDLALAIQASLQMSGGAPPAAAAAPVVAEPAMSSGGGGDQAAAATREAIQMGFPEDQVARVQAARSFTSTAVCGRRRLPPRPPVLVWLTFACVVCTRRC